MLGRSWGAELPTGLGTASGQEQQSRRGLKGCCACGSHNSSAGILAGREAASDEVSPKPCLSPTAPRTEAEFLSLVFNILRQIVDVNLSSCTSC